jgi:ABC-type transporter Mla subunit MlaD
MPHFVFESVIAIAVLAVLISNAVALWLIYDKIKSLQGMAPRLESLINEAHAFLRDARGAMTIVDEVRPSIVAIGETIDKTQDIVNKTSDALETTTKTIQAQVVNRVHDISHLAVAVNQALRHLLKDRAA